MFEKKRGKRFLASIMALVMLLSLAPVGALATEGEGQPAENQAVAQSAVETKDTNENTPTEPAKDSDEATKSEGNLNDEGYSVDVDTSSNDSGIVMHRNGPGNGGNNSANLDNRFYIAILQEENPESFIGNEPQAAVNAGFWFVGKSPSGDYTITGETTNAFDNNYKNYINESMFRSHSKYQNLWESQNVEAIADPSGVDLDGIVTGIDANEIIKAYLVENGKGSENVSDYKLIPYVVKHEKYVDNSSTGGWHIDCQVVKKESVKNISDFTKSVVKNAEQLPAGIENTGYTFPENESVTFSESTTSVTLLYKLTVTGAKDANFTITDESATLVSGSLTGTIPEAGNVDVYVSRTFSANDIKNGYLVNTATIAPNNDNLTKVDDGKDEATANTPATKPETPTQTDTVEAKYFVLMPSANAPSSGNDQGKENYFPSERTENGTKITDDGGVEGASRATGYAGKITQGAADLVKNKGDDGYFKAKGVEDTYLAQKPTNLGYFDANNYNKKGTTWTYAGHGNLPSTLTGFTMEGKEVVWYVIKNVGTETKPDYHVDGYVKGVDIEVNYHQNFTEGTSWTQTGLKSGNTVKIKDYATVWPNSSREGYTFTGWNTKPDGSGDSYVANSEEVLKTSIDLYAQWEQNYTVIFDANGGAWGDNAPINGYTLDNDRTQATSGTLFASSIVSPVVTPTNGQKNFLGWATSRDSSNLLQLANPTVADLKNWTNTNGTTITLYAIWNNNPVQYTYTIHQHFKNSPNDAEDIRTVDIDGDLREEQGTLISTLIVDQETDVKPYVYVASDTKVNGDVYNSATSRLTENGTRIDLYYYLDNWKDGSSVKEDNEKGGDGIPDCDQVLIKYVSSNSDRGTVSPDMEVLTLRKDNENVEIKINGSKATDKGGRNYFSNWTDEVNNKTINDATLAADTIKKAIETAKGGETYTFTANFGYSGGGGGGGSRPTVTIPDDVPTGLNGTDHYAYIIGYGNNDVRPQNNITRAEVATIFFRLLTDETRTANMTKSNSYNDVKDGDWFCCAVSTLSKMGIIKGYEDGSFKPNDPISRAEFAAIAARFDPDGDKTPAAFADVTSHWAKDEISIAANHGWIKGYEDGSFKPDQKITRAETMTLVNRVLNRLPETKDDLHKDMKTWVDNMDETAWYYLAVQEATNSHYFKNKTSTKFEQWTDLRDTRDWSELEK